MPSAVGESAVADLGGGELLLNARSMNHEVTQGRATSRSTDIVGRPRATSATTARLWARTAKARSLPLTAQSTSRFRLRWSERERLTIKRSSTGGRNWSAASLLVQAGRSAGYSSLVKGPVRDDAHDGILFELAAGK